MAAQWGHLTKGIVRVAIVSVMLAMFATGARAGGRVVVWGDDWSTSNSYWGPSASAFTLNSFAWLTAPTGGKKIVVDNAFNTYLSYTQMMAALTGAGYTVTFSPTSSWTAAYLAGFDAALLELGPVDKFALENFIGCGSGLLLIGGNGGSDTAYNPFLADIGLSFSAPVNLSNNATTFVAHPVTTGVTALRLEGPTPINVLSGSPPVLCNQYGFNWLVALQTTLSCAPTPTLTTTWGSLKAHYR